MKKQLLTRIKELFGFQKNWKELENEIKISLGLLKTCTFLSQPFLIKKIDSENNLIILQFQNKEKLIVKIDNFTLKNLQNSIDKVHFKNKYGKDYQYELSYYGFSISKNNNSKFYVLLKTKLNKKNQNSRKKMKMYHKQKIECSKFFLKQMIKISCNNKPS